MSPLSEPEKKILAVAGLGNPGREYENTRHNVGFRVVDRLAREFGIVFQERKFRAAWGTGAIKGQKIVLFKPLTFMNRSGEAAGEVLRYFGIPGEQVLVVHDDLDLPCGRIRVARQGGAAGHRGVLSMIQHLGHQNFPRLKLGIGRPLHGEPIETYVLQPPYSDQTPLVEEMVERSIEIVLAVVSSGITEAMNRFNRRTSSASEASGAS